MKKVSRLISIMFGAAALMASTPSVKAVNISHFAENSKLSEGNWVKVKTDVEGVHEITDAELRQMGFDDPAKVKIFGWGGNILAESLETVDVDDLVQVPAIYTEGKICFYVQGVMKRDVYYATSANFIRYTANAYSSSAYYFITDDDAYTALAPAAASQPETVEGRVSTSYNNLHHERELTSPGSTGKTVLGENFGEAHCLDFDVYLPGFVDGSQVCLYTNFGVNADERTVLNASLNSMNVTFLSNSNRVSASTSEYTFYNIGQARGVVSSLSAPDGKVNLHMELATTGEIELALLDNFTVTYQQQNVLPADSAQMDLYYFNASDTGIEISGLSDKAHVWNVTTAGAPESYTLGADGSFNAALSDACEHIVTFDPTRTLRKISGFAPVENQNLHALATPDMVIVTTPGLKTQAQRIADWHIANDGMEVAIIEQEKIFNEFSSGATDATAVRMFMKMLHMRNPDKLKYLLLFGSGTFDNRHLLGDWSDDLVVTFQSTSSNVEIKSYTTDDYFGMLADDTGYSIAAAPVSVAVGRFPVKNCAEAERVVDKLMGYLTDEIGEWCNNALIVGDQGDGDMHIYQAEGLVGIMNDADIKLNVNKLYLATFPQQGAYAIDARKKWIDYLERGINFMSYVGHGAATYLGKETLVWLIQDSKTLRNKHLPFMTFATCDVAPFDSERRGLAEEIFVNPYGGMIAGMASTRTVFASENDELNRALVTNLFTLDENGEQRTIGEAYRIAKNHFYPYENYNRLNFTLFGDPAMKLHLPKHSIGFTRINDVDIADSNVSVRPLSQVKVSGNILESDGQVNSNFSGKVLVTLYDSSRFHKTISISSSKPALQSYYSREVLSRTDCMARDGKFEATFVVPKFCMAQNQPVLIRAMAVSDADNSIVNGSTDRLVIDPDSDAATVADTEAPVVESMYLDDESNTGLAHTGTSATLYATITDDVAINTQTLAIGNALEVTLDNGYTSYAEARNVATFTNQGRCAQLVLPISGLEYGAHTLTVAVSDIAGNRTTRSIDFIVENTDYTAEITAGSKDARTAVTFAIAHTLGSDAEATVSVVDSRGCTVWNGTTTAATCEWNLTDLDGKRVAPGRYSYYCRVRSASGYAHSGASQIVILAPASE